jgi:hypothetical protein
MSCYFRHLKTLFDEIGIEVTKENKAEIDRAIHKIVGVDYKNCPSAWKAVKNEIRDEFGKRDSFIEKLKQELAL